MTTGAWYHLSTLEKAKDDYSHILQQERTRALDRFSQDPPKRWSWRHLRKVDMTLQEHFDRYFSIHYSPYYYAYPGLVERKIEGIGDIIALALRSEQNLVFLTKDDVRQFGGCLTKPYEPGERPDTEFLLKS